MSTAKPRSLLRIEYAEAAEAYLRNLPRRHFMEAVAQATQRKSTLESLDLVHAYQPEVQVFNELLIQYPFGPHQKPRQVVPDNLVVVHDEPIKADGSFDVLFQPVGPFWVLEYISKNSKRKDYEDSFRKYEQKLKVPYLLLFYPDEQELSLYHHNGKKYVSVRPNDQGRYPIPKLHLELGLLDGWVRYWYKGELLPLPADLQRELDKTRRQLAEARRRAVEEHQGRMVAEREVAKLRAELEQLKGRKKKEP